MKKYLIFTDSCIDLDYEMVNEIGIKVIPLSYEMDGQIFTNEPKSSMKVNEFYNHLRNKKSAKTSQINVSEFKQYWEPYLKDNYDILHISFSSSLSGTCNSAVIAQGELKSMYPENEIIVIDSLSASMGQGLLVYEAAKRKKAGDSITEVAQWVEDNKLKLCHLFIVDSLNFLRRGGRLSTTKTIIGTLLKVKPILHVSNDGKLIPISKARGKKTAISALVNMIKDTIINPEEQTIFVSHGDCLSDANDAVKLIKEQLNVKDIKTCFIGPVIGAHSGPGTLAIFFFGKNR